jgi:hypothetical protein
MEDTCVTHAAAKVVVSPQNPNAIRFDSRTRADTGEVDLAIFAAPQEAVDVLIDTGVF